VSNFDLETLLNGLTRSKLLVAQARAEGMEVSQARIDSIAQGLITGVKGIARELGFYDLEVQEGETVQEAADRAVTQIMREIVQQGRTVYPLQTVAFALKEQYGARISQAGVDRTVSLIQDLRAQPAATPPPVTPPAIPDTGAVAPDSAALDSTPADSAGGLR